jgi:cell division protein FtsA
MLRKPAKQLIVGLDIGTSKIATLIGQLQPNGEMEIVGFGTTPSRGLKRGVVVDIDATVQSIQEALEQAETMTGCSIEQEVYTGIAGNHVRSINSHGIVAIRDKKEVSQVDVDRVIDAAKAVAIPADQMILHISPQEYVIDHQSGIREPVGMSGVRLEAKVHIVTGAVSMAQNLEKCVQHCGLQVGGVVLEQLASSQSVLTDDEKELGVCLVDIGGGTTDIAIFTEGAIRHTAVIPIAGDQVTNDIAVALRTPAKYAEEIKIKYATASRLLTDGEETFEVPSAANRPPRHISKKDLAEVVNARYEELFSLIQSELRRSGFEELIAAGIVLTGGAAMTAGILDLVESTFRMPVRLGMPQYIQGLPEVLQNPAYSTSVGLLLHGAQQYYGGHSENKGMGVKNMWQRMKNWLQGNF